MIMEEEIQALLGFRSTNVTLIYNHGTNYCDTVMMTFFFFRFLSFSDASAKKTRLLASISD